MAGEFGFLLSIAAMSSNPGKLSMEKPIEEDVEILPDKEKWSDALLNASIRMCVDGEVFDGTVLDICVGAITKERLYLVRYTDGDFQHLERKEVLECLMPSANDVLKASDEDTATSCFYVNDTREQTDGLRCVTPEKAMQFSLEKTTKDSSREPAALSTDARPKNTIKDIAKKPSVAPSGGRWNTKPPRASLLTKKPARR